MNEILRDLTPTRIVTYLLFVLSLLMTFITAFMAFNSLDVLQEWTLTIKDTRIEAGEKVIIESVYNKVRVAEGKATRYIECKNKDKLYLRYPLNEKDADRKAGRGGTGIDVVVPNDIPDLPTTCKFSVSIKYKTFIPWYEHPEANSTKEFTLYPASELTMQVGESERTSQTPAQGATSVSQSSNLQSSSSPNSSPKPETVQSNSSQEQQSTPPSQPSLIESILAPITNLLGGN